MIERRRVGELLDGFSDRTLIVLGDLMLDEFVWGVVRRISPEAPVPIVEVSAETYRLGGAANVVANVRALGGTPLPIGIFGNDRAGDLLVDLFRQSGVDMSGLVRAERPTTLKTRIIAHNQQVARTDRESRETPSKATNASLVAAFERALTQAHGVILSDYDKGVVNRDLAQTVLRIAKEAGKPVYLDPKVPHADYYRPVTVITPNQREAELLTGITINSASALREAGRRLMEKFECPHVIITRGEEGMALFSAQGVREVPTVERVVFDVTGAGDTVIATLAMANVSGATMEEAAILANHAAGIAVGKIGTATVTRDELLSDFDQHANPAG